METNLESAILQALRQYPHGFPVAGSQLAEALHVSPQIILDTATAMGQLPPKYDEGFIIVATAAEQFTGRPAGFYVSLQPLDYEPARR